jgi:Short C-terminal domain
MSGPAQVVWRIDKGGFPGGAVGTLAATPPLAAPTAAPAGLVDRLAQLDRAKAAGLISAEEHTAKRSKILEDADGSAATAPVHDG